MPKGLRRFRATLAEIEEATNICPECDSPLTAVKDQLDTKDPGGWAIKLELRYCKKCDQYFALGDKDEDR